MKRTTKKAAKPRTDYDRLCNLFIVAEDARDRAKEKREVAEQLEDLLDKLTGTMLDLASLAHDHQLDESAVDNIYQMFVEAQEFVDTRNLTEVQKLTRIKLASAV